VGSHDVDLGPLGGDSSGSDMSDSRRRGNAPAESAASALRSGPRFQGPAPAQGGRDRRGGPNYAAGALGRAVPANRMRTTTRLKREILKDAVRENLDLLDDRRFLRRRFRGRRSRVMVRVVALVLVPAALFVSITPSPAGAPRPRRSWWWSRRAGPGDVRSPPRAEDDRAEHVPARGRTGRPRPRARRGRPGRHGVTGLSEKEITLDVARRLQRLLAEDGIEVSLTRDSDHRMTLLDRTRLANERRADLFVSIHVNSAPMPGVRGVETYFLGAADGPDEEWLAGRRTWSRAILWPTSGSSWRGLRGRAAGESRRFANAVQRGLVTTLRPGDPRLRDRGVKSAPFVVLVGTRMPGILAEVGCLSDEPRPGSSRGGPPRGDRRGAPERYRGLRPDPGGDPPASGPRATRRKDGRRDERQEG